MLLIRMLIRTMKARTLLDMSKLRNGVLPASK